MYLKFTEGEFCEEQAAIVLFGNYFPSTVNRTVINKKEPFSAEVTVVIQKAWEQLLFIPT